MRVMNRRRVALANLLPLGAVLSFGATASAQGIRTVTVDVTASTQPNTTVVGSSNEVLRVPIGGGSGPGTPGWCWLTRLRGAFRGPNDGVRIRPNPTTSIWEIAISNGAYGYPQGTTHSARMQCAFFKDLRGVTTGTFGSDVAPEWTSTSFGITSQYLQVDFFRPLTQVAGRLWWPGDSTSVCINTNRSGLCLGGNYTTRLNTTLCEPIGSSCEFFSEVWYSGNGTAALHYSVADVLASGTQDITLVAGNGNLCWIDGVGGGWGDGTGATVSINPVDGNWHLVMQVPQTSSPPVVGASCIPINQGP
jgi:hypothetical protein